MGLIREYFNWLEDAPWKREVGGSSPSSLTNSIASGSGVGEW